MICFLIQHEHNLQRAFNALCHSTHLYGRRLVLEWADSEESIDDLRRKTAQHYHEGKLHLNIALYITKRHGRLSCVVFPCAMYR